jgi:AcrR family transcriptional regulator
MASASKLFSQLSYRESSVSMILDDSGLKAPSLYHHYGNKEGLYAAWACRVISDTGKELKAALKRAKGHDSSKVAHVVFKGLSKPGAPDINQILRDIRLLENAESKMAIQQSYLTKVLHPVIEAIESYEPDLSGADAEEKAAVILSVGSVFTAAYSERPGRSLTPKGASTYFK